MTNELNATLKKITSLSVECEAVSLMYTDKDCQSRDPGLFCNPKLPVL